MSDLTPRQIVQEALDAAVRLDAVVANADVILRELSQDRVDQFVADTYASRFGSATTEQVFAEYGAFLYLASDAEGLPELSGVNRLLSRAPFVEAPGWAPYMVHSIGPGFEASVLERLEESLSAAPLIEAELDSATSVLAGIDGALDALAASDVFVLLAGDFRDIQGELDVQRPDGYEPRWERYNAGEVANLARYRGHPILVRPDSTGRRLYVVEPARWGVHGSRSDPGRYRYASRDPSRI